MEWEYIKLIFWIIMVICMVITFWLQGNETSRLREKLKKLTDGLPKDDKLITLSNLDYFKQKMYEDMDQRYTKRKPGKRYYCLQAKWDKCKECDTYRCGVLKYFYGTYTEARYELYKLKRHEGLYNDLRLYITEITKKEYEKEKVDVKM